MIWRNKITLAFLIYLVFMFLINSAERSLFGMMGEKLTYKLRIELLTSILYKQISQFDREYRAPGILTNVMSEDVTALNGMTAETVIIVLECVCSIMTGVAVSLLICW